MKLSQARILTVNGGSSSIKFALFQAGPPLDRILEGRIEGIGMRATNFVVKGLDKADNFSRPVAAQDHTAAVTVLMNWIEERMIAKIVSDVLGPAAGVT